MSIIRRMGYAITDVVRNIKKCSLQDDMNMKTVDAMFTGESSSAIFQKKHPRDHHYQLFLVFALKKMKKLKSGG